MRRLSVFAMLLLFASAAPVMAAIPATRIVRTAVIDPSTGALSSGYTISQRGSGSCRTGSITAQRPDAWRCMIGNEIYDPCFAPATANTHVVYCIASVRTRHLFAITLTRSLPREQANTATIAAHALPSSIDLTDGTSCDYASGATGVIAGRRVNFICSGGRVLLGDPDRSTRVWHIRMQSGSGGNTTLAAIAAAYF